MAETQPRRYPTRARAQGAGSAGPSTLPVRSPSITTTTAIPQRTTRSTVAAGKRKVLTDSTPEIHHKNEPVQATRAKSAKKPASKSKATTGTSCISVAAGRISGAPRRSGRTGTKTISSETLACTRKAVTFTSPAASEDENKENALPLRQASVTPEKPRPLRQTFVMPEKLRHDDLEETDFFTSTPMDALSVKPKRIPKTKMQQPSTGSFSENTPALSPQKVRRPKRLYVYDGKDQELEYELSCPTSPRLQEKPKRPQTPLDKRNVIDGAEPLMPMSKTTILFGSPAGGVSPSKSKESDAQIRAQTLLSERRQSMESQKMDELLSRLTSAPVERPKTPPKSQLRPPQTPPKSQPKVPQTPTRTQTPQYVLCTEPPKFDLMSNPIINERIRVVRRRVLQYAPKTGSPLARSWVC